MEADAKQQPTMTIVITRADGTVVRVGTVAGGRWWQRLAARFRIWTHNLGQRVRTPRKG